jgi:hypothetical protein
MIARSFNIRTSFKKSRCAVLIIGAALLATLAVFQGCGEPNHVITDSGNGYKTLTVTKGITLFSFEFSDFYQVGETTIDEGADVGVVAPDITRTMVNPDALDKDSKTVWVSYSPAKIIIWTYDARDRGATVKEELDRRVRRPDIQVLERSAVTVAGIPGEQATYTSEGLLMLAPAPGKEKPRSYAKSIFFEHAGLMWMLEYESEASLIDRVRVDFEHVVQTFKILD